ncbi:MAG TPA: hypothetical protein VIN57_02195 [Magnetovibrio sp.]
MTDFSTLDQDVLNVTRIMKTEEPELLTVKAVTNLLSFSKEQPEPEDFRGREEFVANLKMEAMGFESRLAEPSMTAMLETPTQHQGVSDRELLGIMALAMLDDDARRDVLQNPADEQVALNCARYLYHEDADNDAKANMESWENDFPQIIANLEYLRSQFDDVGYTGEQRVAEVDSITLIIHGTMARDADWWKPNTGPFWQYIDRLTGDAYAGNDVFRWSGGLLHKHRVRAAQELKTWVDQHPTKKLRVIAHSHGANVCYLAGRLGAKFDQVIALGSPICLQYIPNVKAFGRIDNVFSTQDSIQVGGSMGLFGVDRRGEGRTLTEQVNVTNTWAEHVPNRNTHSSLHEQTVWQSNQLQQLL